MKKGSNIYSKFSATRLYRILSELAESFNEHWVVCSVIQSLPVIWGVIFLIFKPWFTQNNGNMNKLSRILSVSTTVLSIIVIIITNFKTSHDIIRQHMYEEDINNRDGELIVRKVISSAESIVEERCIRLLREYLEREVLDKSKEDFIRHAYDPQKRISAILDELSYCFEKVTELQRDRIFLSAAVNYGTENWQWLCFPPVAGTAKLEELLKNPSMFRQVAYENVPFVYANDKKVANIGNRYYMDKRDESTNSIGSIICWEVAQIVNETKIRMIISVSTYGCKIFNEKENYHVEEEKHMYESIIKEMILEQFEGDLSEALLLLYYSEQKHL